MPLFFLAGLMPSCGFWVVLLLSAFAGARGRSEANMKAVKGKKTYTVNMWYRFKDDEEAKVDTFTRLFVDDDREREAHTWFQILQLRAARIELEQAIFYIYEDITKNWYEVQHNQDDIFPTNAPLKALALTISNMGKESEAMTERLQTISTVAILRRTRRSPCW
eukprot:GHVU01033281.1.p1 GENE.GHVU01033281.1~~GHVU01033281.1.p1  ORF type:complete len:164 (+),score=22.00 GHVU01033281.1:246-737(+)